MASYPAQPDSPDSTQAKPARARHRVKRRGPGEGSIYEYRGRWRGQLQWIDQRGIGHRKTVYGPTKADVRQALDALKVDLDRGLAPPATQELADYLARWLEVQRPDVRVGTGGLRADHAPLPRARPRSCSAVAAVVR